MQQHANTYSVLTHTSSLKSKVKPFFSESSHVAYHINGNGAYSTMQAHILYLPTPSAPGMRSNGQFFFLSVVMLHNKLKGMKLRTPCKHIFCLYTHPQPMGRVQR